MRETSARETQATTRGSRGSRKARTRERDGQWRRESRSCAPSGGASYSVRRLADARGHTEGAAGERDETRGPLVVQEGEGAQLEEASGATAAQMELNKKREMEVGRMRKDLEEANFI